MNYLIPTAAREVYNLHPLFVHFPVALLPTSLLLLGLALWRRQPSLIVAGRACLYLGVLGAIAAVVTGWQAGEGIPHNDTIHNMMKIHKYAAIGVLFVALGLSAWSFKVDWEGRKQAWSFVGVLLVVNVVLVSVGDLGARMVYVEGAGVKAAAGAVSGEESSHDHSEHSHP